VKGDCSFPLSRLREREAKCVSTWQGEGTLAIPLAWRHSRESGNPVAVMSDIHVFFRSPPGRAGYFCFGKSSQNHWRRHDGLANIRLARLPCASRRTRAGANSHIPVLKQSRLSRAPGCDARRHATAPESSLRHGHPWPAW
jgi:hypothetical protein